MEKYFVIENRNVGVVGNPKFMETVLFSGTKEECAVYEDQKRKEYKDRTLVDCFTQSESERNRFINIHDFWNNLSEEEKKETVVINGKTYNKALYEFYNGKQ